MQSDFAPIIACSSGKSENCAISLVRISGIVDFSKANTFFSCCLDKLIPQKATLCRLINGPRVLDQIVVTFYQGPNSYTGENILELAVHGNVINVENIISLFIENKICRHARPGEFTSRALFNKKITLSQVEGLDLFLNAQNQYMLDSGFSTMHGELNRAYIELKELFINLKMAVEFSSDFLEDIGEEEALSKLNNAFFKFKNKLSKLYARTTKSHSMLTSPTVVLIGAPNSGKSTLFNYLLSTNRSIVTDIPGTTRDYVSETIKIKGNKYLLIDTAGLRESSDLVEEIGIKRTGELILDSFFNILVIDISTQFIERDIPENLVPDLVLFTHSLSNRNSNYLDNTLKLYKDIPVIAVDFKSSGPIEPDLNFGPIGPEDNIGPIEPVKINGPIGPTPKEVLEDFIGRVVDVKYKNIIKNKPILIERHCQVIDVLQESVTQFQQVIGTGDTGIISSELRIIENQISELIGIISPKEVLSSIFANFCIGK